MKRSRLSALQITKIWKEREAGMETAEVGRHGIISATFYKEKAKYRGLEVSESRLLRSLVADTSLFEGIG